MAGSEIRPIETGGVEWKVTVNEVGWFTARHPTYGEVGADKYDDLTEKARRATTTQKIKVSVPYARLAQLRGKWTWVKGEATGIHGGTGNVLYREGKDAGQLTGYGRDYLKVPTEQDQQTIIDLLEIRDQADKDAGALQKVYEFNSGLKAEVQAAVREARGGAES